MTPPLARQQQATAQQTAPQVLCLGEVLWDWLADQAGKPLEAVESWTAYPGGAPANVACGLVKLGTPAAFIGCVGQDWDGQSLLQLLTHVGVNVTGVQCSDTAPTRAVYVVRSHLGDRHFAGFRGSNTAEFADAYLQAAAIPEALFLKAKFLVLGTLELAYTDSRAAIYRALALARVHQVKIVMDVNWRPMFWPDPNAAPARITSLLPTVNILKLTDEEAIWLFNTAEPGAIAQQHPNLEAVLITAGERGCRYWLGGHQGQLAAFEVDVEDTTGAGDGFLAGFLHQLLQRGMETSTAAEAVQEMIRYASAVGALTTMRAGAIAAQPTAAEVQAFLYLQQQFNV